MARAEHMFPKMRERRRRTLPVDDDLFFHRQLDRQGVGVGIGDALGPGAASPGVAKGLGMAVWLGMAV